MENEGGSFESLAAYRRAVAQTPRRLAKRFRAVGTAEQELKEVKARSGGEMQRKLRWYDVMALGIGGMLGAGIFVTTGSAAHVSAGPAVIISYVVAGFAALLSAFCYTEFAVEVPAAGGAFSYLRITFGELAAYLTGANLIMEYVISNAAVARSFTSYSATVLGIADPNAWRIEAPGVSPGYNMMDLPALGLVLLLTLFICRSTKTTSTFNLAVTLLHLSLLLFIIVSGLSLGRSSNLSHASSPSSPSGFTPFGARGVFNGAALVYFSYIGYDSVSTLAEEVHHPSKSMPLGISGSVLVVTVLYCLMAAAIVFLVPYDQIDVRAPFSLAFRRTAGWNWASNVVGVGASIGILSSLLVAMLGQARYLCVIGRAHVIPYWFAKVNDSTGTPLNASIFLGVCTAIIALFTDLDILVDLISIGTLFVFYMVANALIFRRHVLVGVTNPWSTFAFLLAISAISVGFVSFWQLGCDKSRSGMVFCGGAILVLTVSFKALVPTVQQAKEWEAPLMPFIAVASIFLNVFLMGSLPRHAYERFGIWSAGALLFYLVYSVHATHDAEAVHSQKICQTVSLQTQSQNIVKQAVTPAASIESVDAADAALDCV